jgi:pimeloyl-ACP methyl ester carboxylesterase
MVELSDTMGAAVTALGIEQFNLMGTSFGGKVALWLAARQPAGPDSGLEAPAAIRPVGSRPPSGTPEEIARRIYAHPERVGPLPAVDPVVQAKTRVLVDRLQDPTATRSLNRSCAGLRRRHWCCSAPSTA